MKKTKKAPVWILDDLYSGIDSPDPNADLKRAGKDAIAFQKRYQGKLDGLDGAAFGRAISEYEAITEVLHKVLSYAQLYYAADVSDGEAGRFQQTMHERVTEISSLTLFFELEINRIEDAELERKLEYPDAAHYAPWLRDIRVFRPHQLSDEAEKLLLEKSVTGRAAWARLFDETLAGLRFYIEDEELTLSDTLNLLSNPVPSVRRETSKAIGQVLGENMRLFTTITNTLAKDKDIEDRWRKYPRPISSRNLVNQVEDDVVEALVSSVEASYPDLSHRYYKLKARWFGVDKLNYWDRNAPLPDDDDRLFDWAEARDIVLGAYEAFDPEMARVAERFFEKGWIDAALRPGKDSGAFSHPAVPGVHPYILMNFHGKARDVMTLAHELGHGVHQVLSSGRGVLMSDTPLTLAETASVFGEMLTFRSMLDAVTDPARRRILLAGKVEDMLNTVVRQIAFHGFERRVHHERASGEVSPERLCDIWMEAQSDSLGPAFRFDDDYRPFWAYIPHFIHTPFYVYAYAFGDCLVNSLYGVFAAGHPGFQEKYLNMLRAGGTLRHGELLAPFGLNASDPDFWKRGLKVVSGFIDELETMA